MKTLVTTILIAAAALSPTAFASLTVDSNATVPVSLRVKDVISPNSAPIQLGATEWMVQEALGAPSERLSADIWIYHGFHAVQELAGAQACNHLLITFAKGRVVELRLVNYKTTEIIAAILRQSPTEERVVSTK